MDYASNVQMLCHFVEKHLVFLDLKDIMNIILTNKAIQKLQFSFPFLVHIGHRCVDPEKPYNRGIRRYFKKLLLRYKTEGAEKNPLQAKILKDLETKYALSRNTILNSSGNYRFQGWKITANGGNGWVTEVVGTHLPKTTCFVTSFGKDRMHYTVSIEKFLTLGVTAEDLMKRAIFKGGCYISRSRFQDAHGKASLIAYDTKWYQLFKQTYSVSSFEMPISAGSPTPAYKKIEISLKSSELKDKTIKYLRLVISGKSEGYNGGWNGARFCDAYIRCYYNDIEGVSGDLDISKVKIDRKLTLEKESKTMEDINTLPKSDDWSSDSDSDYGYSYGDYDYYEEGLSIFSG